MASARRMMLFGLDSVCPEFVRKYQDVAPNLRALMERGAWGGVLPAYPTITPTNWATISTGAWPGTHGITHFPIHIPGEPLRENISGWTAPPAAERLWEAGERAGKKSVLMKYSCSWPPLVQNGIQVDGCGPDGSESFHSLAREKCFSTIDIPPVAGSAGENYPIVRINLMPVGAGLEATCPFDLDGCGGTRIRLSVDRSGGGAYDRVTVEVEGTPVGAIKVGEWTPWETIEFDTPGGKVKGTVRFKLLELSPDGKTLKLYCPQVYPVTGFTHPPELAGTLVEKFGGFIQEPCWVAHINRWVDHNVFFEMNDYQNRWMAEASVYLLSENPWDMFFMQEHHTDHAMHMFLSRSDSKYADLIDEIHLFPDRFYGEQMVPRRVAEEQLRRCLGSVDRMIGRILSQADDETLVVVVSDHGAIASLGAVHHRDVLVRAGLTVYKDNGSIDWTRTKAVAVRDHIYVNLKGRDPDGIVAPGEEYERVRDRVIDACRDCVFEKTGEKAYTLALRKEDAAMIGLYGDFVGDIVVALRAECVGHEHGPVLPTASFGDYSMRALFSMTGPGVRRGARPKPTRSLVDVTPTIAHLMGMPPPRDSEGAVMRELLID